MHISLHSVITIVYLKMMIVVLPVSSSVILAMVVTCPPRSRSVLAFSANKISSGTDLPCIKSIYFTISSGGPWSCGHYGTYIILYAVYISIQY